MVFILKKSGCVNEVPTTQHTKPEAMIPAINHQEIKKVLVYPRGGVGGGGPSFAGRHAPDRNGAGKALFARASAILGYDLAQLCLEGPADKLTSTAYSQPAVMVSSLAALAELKERHPALMQEVGHVAGFSLGEITALVAPNLLLVGSLPPVSGTTFLTMLTQESGCPQLNSSALKTG